MSTNAREGLCPSKAIQQTAFGLRKIENPARVVSYYDKFIQFVVHDLLNVFFNQRMCSQAVLSGLYVNQSTPPFGASAIEFMRLKTQGKGSKIAIGLVGSLLISNLDVSMDTITKQNNLQHMSSLCVNCLLFLKNHCILFFYTWEARFLLHQLCLIILRRQIICRRMVSAYITLS